MSLWKKIKKSDWFLFAALLFSFIVFRLPFFLNPVLNIDVSLTVAEAVSRFFKDAPLLISPDEGYVKFLFVLPVLFFARAGFILSLFPLLFSFLSVLLVFVLALTLFDKKAAWFSAFLLSCSLWHADYSVYIEMYTLYLCQALLLIIVFDKFVKTKNNKYNFLFWLLSIISFLTYSPFIVFVVAVFVWLFIFKKYDLFFKMLKYSVVFWFLFLAYIFKVIKIWEHRTLVSNIVLGNDFFSAVYNFFLVPECFCLFAVLVVLGFFLYRLKKNFSVFVLLLVLVFCAFAFFYTAYLLKLVFFPRYLLFVYPLWLILAGSVLSLIYQRKAFIAAILFMALVYPCFFKVYNFAARKQNIDDIRYIKDQQKIYEQTFSYLEQNIQEGDIVLVDSFVYLLALSQYSDAQNKYPVGMFLGFEKMGISFDYKGKYTFTYLSENTLQNNVLILKKYYSRVWLVCFENFPTDDFISGCVLKLADRGKLKIYLLESDSFSGHDILSDFAKTYLHYPFERV